MNTVVSKDGTSIAYDRAGAGSAVILVDGALCSRAFGPMPELAKLLSQHFTVYAYDRRGRGASGDTAPYAVAREIEDIAALIEVAGGSAALVGLSSGAALALQAAERGLNITRLALYEPPYIAADPTRRPPADAESQLKRLLAEGRKGDAVRYFMVDMVGAPAPMVWVMRLLPLWRKLKAVAPTLPYDAAIMADFSVPESALARVTTPTLILGGAKSPRPLRMAAEAAARAVPGADHAELAGQTHNVSLKVLAPAVRAFLAA